MRAARRLDVAVERRKQRGLTRAGVTDQEDELARIDLDVDVVECRLVGLCRIDLGDMLHQDDGLDTGLGLAIFLRLACGSMGANTDVKSGLLSALSRLATSAA